VNKPTTAEELNSLLADYRNTGMNSLPTVSDTDHPIPSILSGVGAILAYHDYREMIQKYQAENQISAIEWQAIKLGDRLITFPDLNDQLNCLDSDLEVIHSYKAPIMEAWREYSSNKELMFWYEENDPVYLDVTSDDILRLANDCEWAMLQDWDDIIKIELGWGNPLETGYYQYLDSGSFVFSSALRDSHIKAIKESNPEGWEYEDLWACPIRNPLLPNFK